MSTRSMTGFGHGRAAAGGLRVDVEVSSVNRKSLDVLLNVPKSLGALESRLHEEVGRVLSRGRISVSVQVRESAVQRRESVRVDTDLAASYLKALRAAAKKLKLADDLTARSLLEWPGVLRMESPEDDVATLWPLVQRALKQALKAIDAMRAREGQALAKDLEARLRLKKELLAEIRGHAPAAVARYREALRQRIQALRLEVDLPADRLEREVVMFAERADITEEMTRLDSHLSQAAGLLRSPDPAGKALDFVAQEMGREINTIGSKANDAEIARRVVLFKTELDRFREQVQNIE
jgi:uncharacterized protein (TIGR00255 family)